MVKKPMEVSQPIPSTQQQSGFTLLEILVAFVVFVLAFAVVMEVITGAARNTIKSSRQTQIALLAQSKMDEVGILEPVAEGASHGRFADGTTWELQITPFDAPYDNDMQLAAPPVDLFRVDLTLSWRDRNKTRSAHFVTLRAQVPDFSEGRR